MKERILVVDDSAAIRKAIRRILEGLGFIVEEAADGQQALMFCTEWGTADVILLDIDMPVMDGLSFLRALRQSPTVKQPLVIMCSTHNSKDEIEEALALGADEYIMKPFDRDIISSKLAQVGIQCRGESGVPVT